MKTTIGLIHWLPRIICILAILFVSMFALDSFAPGLSLWEQIGAFMMHLIPSFVLLAFLIVAWKWELVGGIIFTIIGVGLSPFIFLLNHNRNHFSVGASIGVVLVINLPFIIVGILFIISHFLKKKKLQDTGKE
ncbi:MAG: hypothetical protein WCI54_09575 [Bacteroidia bacterium]|jgi:hypothetical protein